MYLAKQIMCLQSYIFLVHGPPAKRDSHQIGRECVAVSLRTQASVAFETAAFKLLAHCKGHVNHLCLHLALSFIYSLHQLLHNDIETYNRP